MKTRYGTNQKWIVRPEHHALIRRMFVEIFDAAVTSPRPGFEVFTLAGGENVGVFAESDALDTAQAAKGAWLEFLVSDVEQATELLVAAGVPRIEYTDRDHPYFQPPGAPIFRLAKT